MKSGTFHASRGIWNIILLAGSRWVAWCYAHLLTGRSFWCLSAPWRSLLNSESDLGSNSGLSGNGENVYPNALCSLVHPQPLTMDCVSWNLGSDGQFSARSAWQFV
ncbi:hypothetical protein POTOM_049128 [Populus tomentosa]|uniref:Uncharacterized protein n=1 Tax=Populus tomentosa TaxID=118781 RepID=A0A8X7YDB6_POPTO|nr:hypothetical protein POTOM_049128 [Populus tomentosa]